MTTSEKIKLKTGLFVDERLDTKSGIQEAVKGLSESFLVLEWATAVSKTRAALLRMVGKKVLILVPQIVLIKSWTEEMKKWNLYPDKFEIICYNSLHKYKESSWDIVCLDEAHRWSEMWANTLPELYYDELLMLSATIPYEVKINMFKIGKPRIVSIFLEDAIDWGLVPEPTFYVYSFSLDNKISNQIYKKGSDKKKKDLVIDFSQRFQHYANKKVNLHIKCTELEWYQMITEDIAFWKKLYLSNGEDYQKNRHIRLGLERKNFLASTKERYAGAIINNLDRLVIFCNSIAQCKSLSKGYKKSSVHSQVKNGEEVIDNFNAGVINKLFAVRQLNEGVNLRNPEKALIIQLDSGDSTGKSVSGVQRSGRILRSEFPEIHLIRILFTKDDENYTNFQNQVGKKYFVHVNL